MKIKFLSFFFIVIIWGLTANFCQALAPGTLLYRSGSDGKMFGYSGDSLLEVKKGILSGLNAGHVAVYIGKINGEDYVVEAGADGIVKTPARYFVNEADGEVFLGAKIPREADPLRQARVVAIAKNLADSNLAYDFDLKYQKGPDSGKWTCVGLSEKIYESADISNPNNLAALEYDSAYYAIDITPDGFDNYSPSNTDGDRFSRGQEFSQIARRDKILIPLPELIGFDAGREYQGQRYVFVPYTQFLQPTLIPVDLDIEVSSNFSDAEVRGKLPATSLALRWSLINNPWSSLKTLAVKTKESLVAIVKNIFGNTQETVLVLGDDGAEKPLVSDQGNKSVALPQAIVTKNTAVKKAQTLENISSENNAESANGVSFSNNVSSGADKPAVTVTKATTVKVNTKISGTNETFGVEDESASVAAVFNLSGSENTSANKTASSASVLVSSNSSNPSTTQPSASVSAVSASSQSAPVNINSNTNLSVNTTSADDSPKLARINKIYATGSNDWVELINPTDYDFDLAEAGYRLEKAKTAEDPSLIMRLGNSADGVYPRGTIIKAHGTYLIVRVDASDYYKNKADAIATRQDFNWGTSGYTLYLGIDAISASSDPDIVEAIGFGPDATYYQGSAPAPAITDNYILSRIMTASNNQTDFILIASDDPSIVWETADNTNNNDDSGDNGNGNDNSGDNNNDSGDNNNATSTPVAPPILINKIYATDSNDWLELFNFGDDDFDLALGEYRLEKSKTAEDPSLMVRLGNLDDGSYPGGTIIKAHDKYLVVRDDANEYYLNQADAVITRDEFSWTGADYTLYLGDSAISSSTDADILDAVGYGPNTTYFVGTRPATEIPDNYILNRVGRSGDNYMDFSLLASDDPGIVTSTDDNLSLFVPPTPIVSDAISNLWHFDECYGAGKWAVGRWDCAVEVGYRLDKFNYELNNAINLNNFSLSFQYQKASDFPRLDLKFYNDAGDKLLFILDPGLVTIEGLPNSQWRYYDDVPFNDDWHQASLVVNQAEDYWAVYIDGQEKVRETFLANLPVLTDLEISSDNGSARVDEIVTWNRSLSQMELSANYLLAAPFAPLIARLPQQIPQLKYFWQFEEDTGLIARDNVSQTVLNVSADAWTGRHHNNYALQVAYPHNFITDIDMPITPSSRDLSLAFWWRNSAYPNLGRVAVSLLGGPEKNTNLFVTENDYFRNSFWFNGNYSIFSEGINEAIPNDDAWHHIAMVYDSYRYKLSFYVDGEEKTTRPFIWLKDNEAITRLSVSSNNFSAAIDDLGVWQGALSASQVQEIYNLF